MVLSTCFLHAGTTNATSLIINSSPAAGAIGLVVHLQFLDPQF